MPEERNERTKLQNAVERYITETKGWPKSDYVIHQDRTEESLVVFVVVHKDDEVNPIPGGGKSVEVHVDPEKTQVVKELGFQ